MYHGPNILLAFKVPVLCYWLALQRAARCHAGASGEETLAAAAEPGEAVVFDLPAEIWERISLCLSNDINP